jgi:NAD(P)-dependent dehydrogenase (short-subunit alcohol dehydrogenase family)
MLDPNGSNTTATALVHKVACGRNLKGKKALILAGTGPLGMRAAILLGREGCEVYISSRKLDRAKEAQQHILESHGVEVTPLQIVGQEDTQKILAKGINIVACCGAPGVQMLDLATWTAAPELQIIADVNAVAPFGVEGIKITDNGRKQERKLLYGPIAIGNFKMKVHKAAVRALFESNNKELDFDSIYEIAKDMEI